MYIHTSNSIIAFFMFSTLKIMQIRFCTLLWSFEVDEARSSFLISSSSFQAKIKTSILCLRFMYWTWFKTCWKCKNFYELRWTEIAINLNTQNFLLGHSQYLKDKTCWEISGNSFCSPTHFLFCRGKDL